MLNIRTQQQLSNSNLYVWQHPLRLRHYVVNDVSNNAQSTQQASSAQRMTVCIRLDFTLECIQFVQQLHSVGVVKSITSFQR